MNRDDLPKPNTTCKICGKPYYRCARCIELHSAGVDSWRLNCDTAECYMVWCDLQMPLDKDKREVSKSQWEEVLNYELPDGRKYLPQVQEYINELSDKYTEKEEEPAQEIVSVGNVQIFRSRKQKKKK